MKRSASDDVDDDVSATALSVRAKLSKALGVSSALPADHPSAATSSSLFAKPSSLFKKPKAAAPAASLHVATNAVTASDALHATAMFAKPSSLFKKPKAAAPAASSHVATNAVTASSSSDALHAAAMFGSTPLREREPSGATDKATGITEPTEADGKNEPIWRTLRTGNECLAQLDHQWTRVKIVATTHAGHENARFKVVPAETAKAGIGTESYGGAPLPREVGIEQVREVTTDAARLARGRCMHFDSGLCKRGERCPFAHLAS